MATTIATNKYVIVNNNLIISVFFGKELPEYNENMINVIDVTDINPQPNLNWTYSNGVFTEPKEPISILPSQLQILRDVHNNEILSDIDYMGHTFNFNIDSYNYLSFYMSTVAICGVLPNNFYWLDKSNTEVYMTLDEFKTFCQLISNRVFVSFQQYTQERKSIQ